MSPKRRPLHISELAHNLGVVYDKVSSLSKVSIKHFYSLKEENQALQREVAQLRTSVCNLEKELISHKPLTKVEIKSLAIEIANKPKSIEEEAIKLTEELNISIKRVEGLIESVRGLIDYLASRGVIALPGTRFTTEELQQQRWILRPSTRRNPMAPTRVQTWTLLDGSVSMQFQGYTPILEDMEVRRTNHDDVEITSPENEILAMIREEFLEALYAMKIDPDAIISERRTAGDVGYDLTICHTYIIEAGERELLSTGLAFVGNSKIYSKFDLKSGFHQIAMDLVSVEWTTFTCPFGLKDAPTIFQRKMDFCFKRMKDFIDVYIDDILVFSKIEKDHIKHLEVMLNICEQYGLVLSPTKCKIAVPRIKFLGAKIGEGKLRLQPHIIKKITEVQDDQLKEKKDSLSRLMENLETLAVLTEEGLGGSTQFPLLTEYEDLIHDTAKEIIFPEEHQKRHRMMEIEDQLIRNASLALNELELIQQMKEYDFNHRRHLEGGRNNYWMEKLPIIKETRKDL
ncbi:hypothetical protein ZIOFF_055143 [Zingiber officinale]|uniref:Reverse transcriptase domain-containing protein n=1 Tax=Zingiber officinale TaxID=94328 RepID=A0A8J5FVR6_ZINOF|nr:hypothetical protein ZIOFF_055143 [Zingiber officinale]